MEVEPAHAHGLCQCIKPRHLLRALDQAAGFGHRRCALLGQTGGLGPAAPARPESGALGRITGGMEADVLAARKPGGTRRPTINTGRFDRVVEDPVRVPVALRDRGPPVVVAGKSVRCHRRCARCHRRCTRHDQHIRRWRTGRHSASCSRIEVRPGSSGHGSSHGFASMPRIGARAAGSERYGASGA
jgi:hypothetical protein